MMQPHEKRRVAIRSERYEQRRLRLIADLVEGPRVLDLGYAAMPNAGVSARDVVGFDLERPLDVPSNYTEHAAGDVMELSEVLGGRQFDTVLCGELIEHVERPYDLLREIHRCARAGRPVAAHDAEPGRRGRRCSPSGRRRAATSSPKSTRTTSPRDGSFGCSNEPSSSSSGPNPSGSGCRSGSCPGARSLSAIRSSSRAASQRAREPRRRDRRQEVVVPGGDIDGLLEHPDAPFPPDRTALCVAHDLGDGLDELLRFLGKIRRHETPSPFEVGEVLASVRGASRRTRLVSRAPQPRPPCCHCRR